MSLRYCVVSCDFWLQECQPCEPIREQNSTAIWLDGTTVTMTIRCWNKSEKETLSLVPRPLQDSILQLWRKTDFSPQLQEKVWELVAWERGYQTLNAGNTTPTYKVKLLLSNTTTDDMLALYVWEHFIH